PRAGRPTPPGARRPGPTQELRVASPPPPPPAPIPLPEPIAQPPVPPAPLPSFASAPPVPPTELEAVASPPPEERVSLPQGPPVSAPVTRPSIADPVNAGVKPAELASVAGRLLGDGNRTFTVTPEAVQVEVRGETLVRTAGLLGWTGVIEARAEFKRFRGRMTDKPFGWGQARMHRLVGSGTAWLGLMGRTFLAVDLGDESVYLREDWVFGFEESVMFENGRVPSAAPPDLHPVPLTPPASLLP